MLSDVLNQLLLCVLRVKLGQEMKGDWFLLGHIVVQNLQQNSISQTVSCQAPDIPRRCMAGEEDYISIQLTVFTNNVRDTEWDTEYQPAHQSTSARPSVAEIYLLVHLDPGYSVFDIILEPEKPRLSQSQSPAHKIKKIFPLPFDLKNRIAA
jgi:hypothetical protein